MKTDISYFSSTCLDPFMLHLQISYTSSKKSGFIIALAALSCSPRSMQVEWRLRSTRSLTAAFRVALCQWPSGVGSSAPPHRYCTRLTLNEFILHGERHLNGRLTGSLEGRSELELDLTSHYKKLGVILTQYYSDSVQLPYFPTCHRQGNYWNVTFWTRWMGKFIATLLVFESNYFVRAYVENVSKMYLKYVQCLS